MNPFHNTDAGLFPIRYIFENLWKTGARYQLSENIQFMSYFSFPGILALSYCCRSNERLFPRRALKCTQAWFSLLFYLLFPGWRCYLRDWFWVPSLFWLPPSSEYLSYYNCKNTKGESNQSFTWARHCIVEGKKKKKITSFSSDLLRVTIAKMQPHDQKQLGEVRVYFTHSFPKQFII